MPATIKGIYSNGQVILNEAPETTGPVEVLVTFTGDVILKSNADALNVANRLREFALLQDGWLNGEGIAPSNDGLKWLAEVFESFYNKSLQLPYLYPTVTGGVQAEWYDANNDISLNIDLKSQKAFYQCLNNNNGSVEEINLDLLKRESWQLLNARLLTALNA